jgi:hypothetical protein
MADAISWKQIPVAVTKENLEAGEKSTGECKML